VALHEEGHIGHIEQGLIGIRIQDNNVSEFIHDRYGSLVKFLHGVTRHNDFVLTVGVKVRVSVMMAPAMRKTISMFHFTKLLRQCSRFGNHARVLNWTSCKVYCSTQHF
jgi:hypothetical protein